jgi:transposase-like protein
MTRQQRTYDPETKATVMTALLDGQPIRQIEAETGVPRGTIGHWSKEVSAGVSPVSDAKKEVIGGLLIELLIAKLKSQIALAEHAGDKKWLTLQEASAVAVLLGVSDDKLVRLLEKFENARLRSESAGS